MEQQTANPLDNSRPLDMHRWSEYPEVKQATNQLCEELGLSSNKEKTHCRFLLLDLYHCYLTDPEMYIGVSLNSRSYEMDERYNKLYIKYDVLNKVVTKLRDSGYIDFNIGFKDRARGIGRQTRIKAKLKLIELIEKNKVAREMIGRCEDEEIIILRDKLGKKQKNIKYPDIPNTKRMRNDLERYNDLLAKTDISLSVENHKVDLTRKKIYRIFNNGTWTEGGRYYGGWWIECKKELRPHILINGQSTKECDFSCMHMHLLYALECINYADKQEDAYTIEGYDDRDLFKQLLLIALNANSQPRGIIALLDDLKEDPEKANTVDYETLKAALKAFKTKHSQVAHYFFKSKGTTLQYFDSLIAEDIINHFTKRNIPVLTVHDSFIIQDDLSQELVNQMLVSYYKVVKFYYNTKGKLVHGMYMPINPSKEYVKLDNTINIKVK